MRQLLILALIIVAVWWVRRSIEHFKTRKRTSTRAAEDEPQRMLACAHCGVHVPEGEGVESEGRFFCCDAHRRLGVKR